LDAEAIAEAAMRPTMRFVEVESQAQSDMQALHRARERLVSERTALINHLRALLLERGIVAPQGRRKLEEELAVFADEDGVAALTPRIRLLIEDLRAEWRALDERIEAFDGEFVRMARDDEAARCLTKILGIGTINATALAAAVARPRTIGVNGYLIQDAFLEVYFEFSLAAPGVKLFLERELVSLFEGDENFFQSDHTQKRNHARVLFSQRYVYIRLSH
jgi:hypothetical protein